MQPGSADVSASGPSVCDLATSAQTSTNCQCESLEKPHVVQKWLHHTGCLESTPAGCRPQLEAHLGGLAGCCQLDPRHAAPVTHERAEIDRCANSQT
jgi:hypothetical protein